MLWMIYNSFFQSQISYLNPIWNGCSLQLTNQIQRLRNRKIKNIKRKSRYTSTRTLYKYKLNINKFSRLQTLLAIHKIKTGKMKFNSTLNYVENVQKYNLRNLISCRPTFFRKAKCTNSIQSVGVRLFNTLPTEIKNENDTRKFKIKAKNLLLEQDLNV